MFFRGRARRFRLFEVLIRNRQSAVELLRCTTSVLQQPLRMFTIPPRQRLSSATRLAIQARGRARRFRLFEVLTRNRQSAVGLLRCTTSVLQQPLRMFTIPPRQRLSSATRLAIRARDDIHVIKHTHTRKALSKFERERETRATRILKFISLLSRVFSKRFFLLDPTRRDRISDHIFEEIKSIFPQTITALFCKVHT